MLKISKNDPGALILLMVGKVAICMVVYFAFALILNLPYEVIIWTLYFLSFIALACAIGDVKTKKRIFFSFALSFLCILLFSDLLNLSRIAAFIIIIVASYFAFWLRKYGNSFQLFPGYLVIVLAISSMHLPVKAAMLWQLTLSLLFAGFLFYVLVIIISPWDTPNQLKSLIRQYVFDTQHVLRKLGMKLNDSENKTHEILALESYILERAELMQKKGRSWILKPERKIYWDKNCVDYHNLVILLCRIVSIYQSLLLKPPKLIQPLTKEMQLQELILIALRMPVLAITLKEEGDFISRYENYESKLDFLQRYMITHQSEIKGSKALFYDLLIALESIVVTAKHLRRNFHALI